MEKRNKVIMILGWVVAGLALAYFFGIAWLNNVVATAYQQGGIDFSNATVENIFSTLQKDGYIEIVDNREKDKPKKIILAPVQPQQQSATTTQR